MAPQKGSKRTVRERQALDLGSLTVARVTDRAVMAQFRRTKGDRDAEQRQVDAIVEQAYNAWVSNGRPENWADQPGILVTLPHPSVDFPLYDEKNKTVEKNGKQVAVLKDGKPVIVKTPTDCQFNTFRWRVARAAQFFELRIRFGDVHIEKGDDGEAYAEAVFVATEYPETDDESGDIEG